MTQIAPIDPGMRKIVLPSIIRISDSLAGIILSRMMNRNEKNLPSKTRYNFPSGLVQLKLEFEGNAD